MWPAIIGAITGLGSILGKSSEKRAEGRAAEAQINAQRDQIASQNFRSTLDAILGGRQQELSERQFALNAPNTKLSQLIRGDILQNVQDPKITVPGLQRTEITGGLRPSMLSDSARQGGSVAVQNALDSLLRGEKFNPLTLPAAPGQTPLPQPGKLDSFMNIAGLIGAGTGAVAPFLPKKAPALGQFDPSGSGGY